MTEHLPKPAAGPRSIALIGPQGAGKSTLFEALLAAAGSPAKRQAETRARSGGAEARLGHCSFLNERWSIIDCPGSVEFSYETEAALMAVDLAVVVCEPATERVSNLPLLLKTLEERGLPHLIFINKIDTLAGSFHDAIAALQAHSARPLLPRQLPIRAGDAVIGYVDVVTERAFRYGEQQRVEPIELPPQMRETEKEALTGLTETLADQDDELMEKLLDDVTPTPDELYQHMRKDQAKGSIVEVLIGSASRGQGVWRLWKALRHDVPEASETAQRRGVPNGDQPAVQILQDRAGGQAQLRPGLARPAARRRNAGQRSHRRHPPLRRNGIGAGHRGRRRRTRRARPARRRCDRRVSRRRRAGALPGTAVAGL